MKSDLYFLIPHCSYSEPITCAPVYAFWSSLRTSGAWGVFISLWLIQGWLLTSLSLQTGLYESILCPRGAPWPCQSQVLSLFEVLSWRRPGPGCWGRSKSTCSVPSTLEFPHSEGSRSLAEAHANRPMHILQLLNTEGSEVQMHSSSCS